MYIPFNDLNLIDKNIPTIIKKALINKQYTELSLRFISEGAQTLTVKCIFILHTIDKFNKKKRVFKRKNVGFCALKKKYFL
jgi:hypothetical protein